MKANSRFEENTSTTTTLFGASHSPTKRTVSVVESVHTTVKETSPDRQRDLSAILEEDPWEKSPKTDYTYSRSGSYASHLLNKGCVSPNMSRRRLRCKNTTPLVDTSMDDLHYYHAAEAANDFLTAETDAEYETPQSLGINNSSQTPASQGSRSCRSNLDRSATRSGRPYGLVAKSGSRRTKKGNSCTEKLKKTLDYSGTDTHSEHSQCDWQRKKIHLYGLDGEEEECSDSDSNYTNTTRSSSPCSGKRKSRERISKVTSNIACMARRAKSSIFSSILGFYVMCTTAIWRTVHWQKTGDELNYSKGSDISDDQQNSVYHGDINRNKKIGRHTWGRESHMSKEKKFYHGFFLFSYGMIKNFVRSLWTLLKWILAPIGVITYLLSTLFYTVYETRSLSSLGSTALTIVTSPYYGIVWIYRRLFAQDVQFTRIEKITRQESTSLLTSDSEDERSFTSSTETRRTNAIRQQRDFEGLEKHRSQNVLQTIWEILKSCLLWIIYLPLAILQLPKQAVEKVIQSFKSYNESTEVHHSIMKTSFRGGLFARRKERKSVTFSPHISESDSDSGIDVKGKGKSLRKRPTPKKRRKEARNSTDIIEESVVTHSSEKESWCWRFWSSALAATLGILWLPLVLLSLPVHGAKAVGRYVSGLFQTSHTTETQHKRTRLSTSRVERSDSETEDLVSSDDSIDARSDLKTDNTHTVWDNIAWFLKLPLAVLLMPFTGIQKMVTKIQNVYMTWQHSETSNYEVNESNKKSSQFTSEDDVDGMESDNTSRSSKYLTSFLQGLLWILWLPIVVLLLPLYGIQQLMKKLKSSNQSEESNIHDTQMNISSASTVDDTRWHTKLWASTKRGSLWISRLLTGVILFPYHAITNRLQKSKRTQVTETQTTNAQRIRRTLNFDDSSLLDDSTTDSSGEDSWCSKFWSSIWSGVVWILKLPLGILLLPFMWTQMLKDRYVLSESYQSRNLQEDTVDGGDFSVTDQYWYNRVWTSMKNGFFWIFSLLRGILLLPLYGFQKLTGTYERTESNDLQSTRTAYLQSTRTAYLGVDGQSAQFGATNETADTLTQEGGWCMRLTKGIMWILSFPLAVLKLPFYGIQRPVEWEEVTQQSSQSKDFNHIQGQANLATEYETDSDDGSTTSAGWCAWIWHAFMWLLWLPIAIVTLPFYGVQKPLGSATQEGISDQTSGVSSQGTEQGTGTKTSRLGNMWSSLVQGLLWIVCLPFVLMWPLYALGSVFRKSSSSETSQYTDTQDTSSASDIGFYQWFSETSGGAWLLAVLAPIGRIFWWLIGSRVYRIICWLVATDTWLLSRKSLTRHRSTCCLFPLLLFIPLLLTGCYYIYQQDVASSLDSFSTPSLNKLSMPSFGSYFSKSSDTGGAGGGGAAYVPDSDLERQVHAIVTRILAAKEREDSAIRQKDKEQLISQQQHVFNQYVNNMDSKIKTELQKHFNDFAAANKNAGCGAKGSIGAGGVGSGSGLTDRQINDKVEMITTTLFSQLAKDMQLQWSKDNDRLAHQQKQSMNQYKTETDAMVKRMIQEQLRNAADANDRKVNVLMSKLTADQSMKMQDLKQQLHAAESKATSVSDAIAALRRDQDRQSGSARSDIGLKITRLEGEYATLRTEIGHLKSDLALMKDCCKNRTALAAMVKSAVDEHMAGLGGTFGGAGAKTGSGNIMGNLGKLPCGENKDIFNMNGVSAKEVDMKIAALEEKLIAEIKKQVAAGGGGGGYSTGGGILGKLAGLGAPCRGPPDSTVAAAAAGAAAGAAMGGKSKHCGSAGGGDARIRALIKEALLLYGADKTGMPDLALESAGGSIISTRCSETYQRRTAQLSLFGIPLWYASNSPRTVIQPDVLPGQCWAFKGSQGYLVIQLAAPITPTSFTVEHISKSLSPTGKIDSAPKDFSFWGLQNEKDHGDELGRYTYNEAGDPIQNFAVTNPDAGIYPMVEMKIHSNHGNLEYTCLYRVRVHGILRI